MKALSIVAAAILLTTSGAALAQANGTQAAPAPPPAEKEKKICKTEKMTGSLTRVTRTCLTEAQWARMAEITRKNVDGVINDANQRGALGAAPTSDGW